MADDEVVLPESLVAELIEKVGGIADSVDATFTKLLAERDNVRAAMIDRKLIHPSKVPESASTDLVAICVDGASLVEVDRAASYGISCVARVGPNQLYSAFQSNMFFLPHMINIDGLAQGLMFMQEMMMAVETAKAYPDSVVFIDGGKSTFIIKINQFYTAFEDESKEKFLETWKKPNNKSEQANILRAFESQNWFVDFFSLPNIVGLVKLVTTDDFVVAFLPEFDGRFDDKVIASLVLEPGERTRGVALKNVEALKLVETARKSGRTIQIDHNVPPFHINKHFRFSKEFEDMCKILTHPTSEHQVHHNYFFSPSNAAVYKVEFTKALDDERFGKVFEWLAMESCAVDLLEPYPMYVADRFVKEAVTISRSAISEITRSRISSDVAFGLTGPYRTN